MLRLIGLVVSIALADALNPATVGPGLYLASGEHPRRAVLEFTGAVAAVNFAGGVLLTGNYTGVVDENISMPT